MINLEEIISEEFEKIDLTNIIESQIRALIENTYKETIKEKVNKQIDSIITAEIDKMMEEGVTTSTGWGDDKQFPSFKDFFKQELCNRIYNNYDLAQKIREIIREKVTKIYEGEFKQLVDKSIKSIQDNFELKIKEGK